MHDRSLDITPDIAVWVLVLVAAAVIALAIGAMVFAILRRNQSNPPEK